MLLNNFTGREKSLAIATLSVILIAVVYVFLITPLAGGWNNINNYIRSRVGMLEKDYRILADRKTIASEYSELSKHTKSGGSEEQAVADTLTYIENVSRNSSCFIVNIKPISITTAASYKEILIDVTAEANIEQFSKFLYDIENPRSTLMNVKRFTLSSKSAQPGALRGTFFISKTIIE